MTYTQINKVIDAMTYNQIMAFCEYVNSQGKAMGLGVIGVMPDDTYCQLAYAWILGNM